MTNKWIEKEAVIEMTDVGKCSSSKKTVVKAVHN